MISASPGLSRMKLWPLEKSGIEWDPNGCRIEAANLDSPHRWKPLCGQVVEPREVEASTMCDNTSALTF